MARSSTRFFNMPAVCRTSHHCFQCPACSDSHQIHIRSTFPTAFVNPFLAVCQATTASSVLPAVTVTKFTLDPLSPQPSLTLSQLCVNQLPLLPVPFMVQVSRSAYHSETQLMFLQALLEDYDLPINKPQEPVYKLHRSCLFPTARSLLCMKTFDGTLCMIADHK